MCVCSVTKSCLTLCNPMDYSPYSPYSLLFLIGSLCMLSLFNCVQLSSTPWTVDCQAPLSMGLSRQEYWSELPFPSLGDLSDPGIKTVSPASPALAGWFFTTTAPGKYYCTKVSIQLKNKQTNKKISYSWKKNSSLARIKKKICVQG